MVCTKGPPPISHDVSGSRPRLPWHKGPQFLQGRFPCGFLKCFLTEYKMTNRLQTSLKTCTVSRELSTSRNNCTAQEYFIICPDGEHMGANQTTTQVGLCWSFHKTAPSLVLFSDTLLRKLSKYDPNMQNGHTFKHTHRQTWIHGEAPKLLELPLISGLQR